MYPPIASRLPLRAYQKLGVDFLYSRTSALLADAMGLGKTIQVIHALRKRFHESNDKSALVVAPNSLLPNWEHEFKQWAPEIATRCVMGSQRDRLATYQLPVPVLICSYDQIRNDSIFFDSRMRFDTVVLDEAQRIKNPSSATALACRILPRQSSWAVTGTPLENSQDDLVSIFGFVLRGLIQNGMCRREMHERIRHYFMRRTKEEVLAELPPIQIQDLRIQLEPEQAIAYKELWERRHAVKRDAIETKCYGTVLQLISSLKQICNADFESGSSAKLNWLKSFVGELCQEKVIVFSQYVRTLEFIYDHLKGRLAVNLFLGEMDHHQRHRSIEHFERENGPQVLLVSLKAGGVGLNIPSATHVVLFDRWWNPALEDQAIHRAHRFGRSKTLFVLRFVTRETIEERIELLLAEKRELFKAFVGDAPNAEASSNDLLQLLHD
jgi:SNF2 family DNA or RNA helicase